MAGGSGVEDHALGDVSGFSGTGMAGDLDAGGWGVEGVGGGVG